ncbi:MAG: hypothetical protein LBD17_05750 [Endomicrobium sp.]|jgi:uncharacterized membrane-anchored protein YhcB (DUF1043 family)|nr:hypothetical protein [Endomicrobium sp.]
MLQTVIITLIVAIAIIFLIKRLLKGKCNCNCCKKDSCSNDMKSDK